MIIINKKGQISLELLIILSIVIIVVVIASIVYISLTTKDVSDTSSLIEDGKGSVTRPVEDDPADYNVIAQIPVGLIINLIND